MNELDSVPLFQVDSTGPAAPAEDDLLASFFTEISTKPEPVAPAPSSSAPPDSTPAESAESANTLTEKYVNQDLGDGKGQVERLTGPHYEWKNLNPYAVFQLDIDATEEDIKYRYKKLSLKVHPDRLRNVEKAREAFEEVCHLSSTQHYYRKMINCYYFIYY